MNPMVLGLATVAGLAVLFIAVGLAGLGGPSLQNRLERYASTKRDQETASKATSVSLGDLIQGSAALAQLNRGLERRGFGANLAREIARADLRLRVSEYLAIWIGTAAGVPLALVALSPVVPALANPVVWIVGGVVGLFLPRFWLSRRKSKRIRAFNAQLADTITLIANSLRAGSSFLQAIELVVRESRPPIGVEFGRVIREVNLGLPFDAALENMVRRVRSEDLELMVTAIAIQHQVGGNLAEILDTISHTIRERVRIKGEIRSLTAMQRYSGYLVAFLPIGLSGIIFLIAPTFLEPMFQKPPEMLGLPLGVCILALAGFSMLVGVLIIRRIVDIEV